MRNIYRKNLKAGNVQHTNVAHAMIAVVSTRFLCFERLITACDNPDEETVVDVLGDGTDQVHDLFTQFISLFMPLMHYLCVVLIAANDLSAHCALRLDKRADEGTCFAAEQSAHVLRF